MKKIIWTFGLIAGGIVAALMAVSLPLFLNGTLDPTTSQVLGYTSMVLAFLAVFFGIRSYREQAGGTISFGRAFKVGILMTLIACAVYVVGWEIVYFNFLPDFGDRYTAAVVADMRADGATAEQIAKVSRDMAEFTKLYANPLFNVAITFLEIFPVGLIMTLISAAILRTKKPAAATA